MPNLNPEDVQAIALIDVDQTLIRGPEGKKDQEWQGESWFLLTDALKADINEHIKIFTDFRNAVNGDEAEDRELHNKMAHQLIDLWEKSWGKPITKTDLEDVCELIKGKVSKKAQEAMVELIKNGILPIVATGGIEDIAQSIAHLLKLNEIIIGDISLSNFDMWFGNTEFIFNEDNILINFYHKKDIIGHKGEQAERKIKELIELLGLDKDIPIIAVGDGKSDLALFLKYLGIAFKPTSNDLKMEAKSVAENWPRVVIQILTHVKQTENEISGDKIYL